MNATEMSKLLDSNPNNRAISTWTGHGFDLFDKSTWKFNREDIARSLSNMCRYMGHIQFRSVAQHSLQVADMLEPQGRRVQLLGLLHDASEAYLLDIPRPWKGEVSIGGRSYFEVEDELQMAIFEWAGVLDLYHGEAWNQVKAADLASYQWEIDRRDDGSMPLDDNDMVMEDFLGRWERLARPESQPLPPPNPYAFIDHRIKVPGPSHAPGMERATCVSTPSRMWGTNGQR